MRGIYVYISGCLYRTDLISEIFVYIKCITSKKTDSIMNDKNQRDSICTEFHIVIFSAYMVYTAIQGVYSYLP